MNREAGQLSVEGRDTLALLERYFDDRPITAREIAEAVGLAPKGNVRTRRRKARRVITKLRKAGKEVCAICTSNPGYWLARWKGEYGEYLNARRLNAKFEFVAAREMGRAASERETGQKLLWA